MKSSARLYKDSKTRSLSASSAVQYIEYKQLSYQRLKQLLVLSARDRVAAGKSTDFTNMNTDTRVPAHYSAALLLPLCMLLSHLLSGIRDLHADCHRLYNH